MSAPSRHWSPGQLFQALLQPPGPTILDVREEEAYEGWHIQGRGDLTTLNIPFREILDEGMGLDVGEVVADYTEHVLQDRLPPDRPIVAVCPEGRLSAHLVEALGALGWEAVNLAGGMQAWASYYHAAPIVAGPDLSILQVGRPARGCLSYLIESGGRAAIVDPLRHTAHYQELLHRRGLALELVLDTHVHADHLSGGPALSRDLGVPYGLHPYDGIHPLDVLPATFEFEPIRDGQVFEVGSARIQVLHAPGHTLGNVALLVNGEYLLPGDTIFLGSVGRPDLGGRSRGWAPLHYRSLKRLVELPPEAVVLPCHHQGLDHATGEGVFTGTLSRLLATNEGLQQVVASQDAFCAWLEERLPRFPAEYADIKRANIGLLTPDEATAAQWELGPNVCALACQAA